MWRSRRLWCAAAAAAAAESPNMAAEGGEATQRIGSPKHGPGVWDDPRDQQSWYRPVGTAADEYGKLPLGELRLLLNRRVEQVRELRDIHERTHLAAEKTYRKQLLDYDEKSMVLGSRISNREQSNVAWHREELKRLRDADWYKARDQTLAFFCCLVTTGSFWYYNVRHYPYKAEKGTRRTLWSSSRVMGNPFTFGGSWYGRAIETDFEKELRLRKAEEKQKEVDELNPKDQS